MDKTTDKINLLDESDRGAVIVGAALLEDDLIELIKSTIQFNGISAKHVEELFDLNGPLSSFSSKALICYSFGLIPKDIFDDLTKIRKLRNKFAHSSNTVDFLSKQIKAQVDQINCCIEAANESKLRRFNLKKHVNDTAANPEPTDADDQINNLTDWEARAQGFMKVTKVHFCIGVYNLRIKIKKHQLLNTERISASLFAMKKAQE